ncbi:MAG: preprotein translocase subunit SecE [bacterium]
MKNNLIFNYLAGVWLELKKVNWPTRKEVINHTIIVIVSAALATMIAALLDYGLTRLIEFIVENKI